MPFHFFISHMVQIILMIKLKIEIFLINFISHMVQIIHKLPFKPFTLLMHFISHMVQIIRASPSEQKCSSITLYPTWFR